jgi:plastocyanin
VSTRRHRLALALICAGALLPSAVVFAAGPADAASAAKPATHHVVIDGLKNDPETLTVRRGDTIIWTNKDPFPHTVTAPGKFDSHDIPPGGSWKYVARVPGDYAYICTLHPNMKGTLNVE